MAAYEAGALELMLKLVDSSVVRDLRMTADALTDPKRSQLELLAHALLFVHVHNVLLEVRFFGRRFIVN